MVINFQKILVLGILIIMTIRMLYLFIRSKANLGAEMGSQALYAMLYSTMILFAMIFYYDNDFIHSSKCISFSSWKDFVFIIMFCIPIILTIWDYVKK